jgi:pyrroline-5-carboxylate reductase
MATETSFEVGIIGAGIMGEALLVAISNAGTDVSSIAIADKRSERRLVECLW